MLNDEKILNAMEEENMFHPLDQYNKEVIEEKMLNK
jgi:hypothetical protein